MRRTVPGPPPHTSRTTISARFLVVGLVGSVSLAVVTVGLPLAESTRLGRTTLALADDSQKATYYLGEVGHQLARLRFRALLPGSWEELADIEQRLEIAFDRLPGSLDAEIRSQWAAVEVDARRLRQTYRDATNLVRAEQPARAAELLAAGSYTTMGVHAALDDLARVNRVTMLTRLQAAHRQASRVGIGGFVLVSVFVAGLIAIWSVMIRMLRRQGQRLDEYTERLESSNADLDAFAGRVAHDLKNALAPIALATEVLRHSPEDTAALLRLSDRIERSSQRALAIVNGLLAFSRAARTNETDEASAPTPTIKSVIEELTPLITKLDVVVEVDELPDAQIRCSPGLLQIVLANLCGNAVKYLDGRSERRVHVAGRIDGPAYQIVVEDTGPGIPNDALEKIFEPFFRVPGIRAPGSGIGLATVRRIVDARGGRIEVESEVGRGSCFRVWLPLVQA